MKRKLTTYNLAMENIRQKPLRSAYMIILVAIFSIILYVGSIFSVSLSQGLESLSNRLGADVIVVPAGYRADIESVLLKGEPSSFYLPENTLDKLKQFDEIEKMTPQIYIATLSAACCAYPVQIIGIDIKSDFLISPWINHEFDKELKDGEVIIGNRVRGKVGDNILFFNKNLKITARLKQTGMGFDATVFVNKNTARMLAKESQRITANRVAEEDIISSVMIKAKAGTDSVKLASKISRTLGREGIFAMFSKKFVNSISSNLKTLATCIVFFIVALWCLAVIILGTSFIAVFNERKKEMAILRILGASKKKLRNIILSEATLISLYGAVLGSFLGVLVSLIGLPKVADVFSMPFLSPSISLHSLIFLMSFILATIIGPLATLRVANKIIKKDSYLSFKEEV
ncbi:MAG: FtsX-like permease family protein [Fusobacterium sp.]|nr:FtsX-like permease family protein [Fusobacterium sp.]